MRGRYVAFEGIEGAGKSTVAARVAARLSVAGHRLVTVREPGGTAIAEQIRSVLLDGDADLDPWAEALLFAAARAQLAREVIEPALAGGSWVIGDRSVYSSLAYQGGGRRLGIDTVRSVNVAGLGSTWPDLVVLLRVDVATGLDRQEVPDRIGAAGSAFQSRVAATFDEIARREPERVVVIDAARDLDRVVEDVVAEIEARWPTT